MLQRIEFNKDNSQALKGLAILLLLLHHNFREAGLFEAYTVSFRPFPQEWVVNVASMSKICVSLFAFITGYGLYLCCKKSESSEDFSPSKWVAVRYIKTFSGYWLIWILSAVITQIIDGRFTKVYFENNFWDGLVNAGLDFIGIANLFQSPTLNATWWYMSAAFVFILITPILVKNEKYLPIILLVTLIFTRMITGTNGEKIFTGGNSTWAFITIYMMGIIFARYNIVEKIVNANGRWFRFVIEMALLIIAYKAYPAIDVTYYWELKWTIIPIVVILFSIEFIIWIPFIKQILLFLGKHSMNIFLVHTFIRHYYLADFTYSWKHFILIIAVLLIISLAISIIIELIKKLFKYDNKITSLCNTIDNTNI